MIAGNPNSGRLMTTALLVAFIALILMAMLIAYRKRIAPEKEPPLPLHPSMLVVNHRPSFGGFNTNLIKK
jgi:hypothetical protein